MKEQCLPLDHLLKCNQLSMKDDQQTWMQMSLPVLLAETTDKSGVNELQLNLLLVMLLLEMTPLEGVFELALAFPML